jgi:hypothetical protein
MGLPSYIKMTLMPFLEASHSTIKVFVKSGVANTEAMHITYLRSSKAFIASGVQENAYFFSNVVKGVAILP